jgi:antitoxin VapB
MNAATGEPLDARSSIDIYSWSIPTMGTTAKLFKNGRSQAVRLPREFRFDGDRVRVRKVGRGVLVEPIFENVADWFAELDRFGDEPFMPEGRHQPATPQRKIFRK